MLLATSSPGTAYGSKNGSSGRSRTGMVFFTKEVHCSLCHGGMKLVLPRGLAPRTFAFARRHAGLLHLGSFKTTSCRCRPGPCGLEDRHARCYINDVKWWLNSVSRRTLLGFSEALIFLSYSAVNWSLHEVTLLGLSVIGRLLYF